jgi:hypothetical protein
MSDNIEVSTAPRDDAPACMIVSQESWKLARTVANVEGTKPFFAATSVCHERLRSRSLGR